jgi:hypothetical protein
MPISTTRPGPLLGRCLDQRPGELLFVLTLGEVVHRDVVGLGEAVHLGDVRRADPAERRRRRDPKPALLAQEVADHPDRLQLGHIALQEDPVDRPAGERHVVAQ